jgi:hypothetical protein
MKLQRSIGSVLAIGLVAVAALAYGSHPAMSSDHQDSPTTVNRPGADITDVFVFPSPANAANVVLAMDVHPLITSAMAGGPTGTGVTFDPGVLYQFKIAHGTNTTEDTVIQFTVNGTGANQTITMHGPAAPFSTGATAPIVNTVVNNNTLTIPFNGTSGAQSNGINVFAGLRSDPFYFDLFQFFKIVPDRLYSNHPEFGGPATVPAATAATFNGFLNASNMNASGDKTYTCSTNASVDALNSTTTGGPYDVLSLVVEIPKSLIAPSTGSSVINVWATTSTTTGS